MAKSLKDSLSSLSAEEDKQFEYHFIETKYIKRLLSDKSDIIYGTKGVGKTALRRALTELNGDYYYNTITVELDKLSFEAVYHRLSELNATVKHEMHTLSESAWKNTLLCYALLALTEKLPNNSQLYTSIEKILRKDSFINSNDYTASENSNFRIMNVIESFFKKIISLPLSEEKSLVGLTPEQQNVINKFPLNDDISTIMQKVIDTIKNKNKKILVCIDGFDSIVKHAPESREAIFTGLIAAIYTFRLDKAYPQLSEAFCFKAFLPLELTREAHEATWDADKHSKNVHFLSWDESDFKSFIEKRFYPFSRKKSPKFNDLWVEFFPEKVPNSVHGVEENAFDYIIRHTLYRPRQILDHIHNIIALWDEGNSPNDKIHPSFIPGAVAKNNKIMAANLAAQLSRVYPQIISFLKSWQGSSTIIEVGKFREKINRYFLGDSGPKNFTETDKIFDELFDYGIFGIHTKAATNPISKKIEFRFAFVGDNINSSIHDSTSENDLVAFSPMLREYCGCNAANGIIVPVTLDNFA